ncbi:unnamed protein product [Lepeophtheirus salmonis]|uniref:(salmon louse) hypothetical protein n=1 Tax=Lepeophtheirus salmonis TaxID=72036 RepID=A0A7R8CY78_LEPSM|nr:unnamed protein product [Lepeophtheirus salmonis]CAF2967811.1 unnamed protein product [Lepeophtheirus salmonis]
MHYNQSVRGKIIEYNQSIEFWSPYQNFSKFVCRGSNNPLEKAANVVTQQVLHILTHPSSEYPSRYYEAKKLFDSCTSIAYFKELDKLLAETSIETLSNFLHWKGSVEEYIPWGPMDLAVIVKGRDSKGFLDR